MARRLAGLSAALMMVVLAASAPPPRVALTDLAASPSAPSASYEAPLDLRLPDEAWRDDYRQVAGLLSTMLRTSMSDPRAWQLTSDRSAYELVYGRFEVSETSGRQASNSLYKEARAKAFPGERIGHRIASIFPADARPQRVYAYKIGWDVREADGGLRVAAQAWVGYDVGQPMPVLVARELDVTIKHTGNDVTYLVDAPQVGWYSRDCSDVVDGVLRAQTTAFDAREVAAWKKETGRTRVRPLLTAFRQVAAASGPTMSRASSRAAVKKCLADAAAKP
jgi:hypothetical protein